MMRIGLGRALWAFGFLQAAANLLYSVAALARHAPLDLHLCANLPAIDLATRAWTYASIASEQAAQGMGTAAQGVLLLRVCDKRYSATQFALLSSLFALGRWAAGCPAAGWRSGWAIRSSSRPVPPSLPCRASSSCSASHPSGSREVRTAEAADPLLGPPA